MARVGQRISGEGGRGGLGPKARKGSRDGNQEQQQEYCNDDLAIFPYSAGIGGLFERQSCDNSEVDATESDSVHQTSQALPISARCSRLFFGEAHRSRGGYGEKELNTREVET